MKAIRQNVYTPCSAGKFPNLHIVKIQIVYNKTAYYAIFIYKSFFKPKSFHSYVLETPLCLTASGPTFDTALVLVFQLLLSTMSQSANEQRELKMNAQRKLAQAKTPIEKLRYMCLSRGAGGINSLGRQFRIIDDDGNKQLSKEEFTKGCHDFKVDLTKEEIDQVFAEIDRDGSNTLNFDEFLEALRVSRDIFA